MSLGGTNNAVAGINLTDAELAQIQTTATGTVTIGDSTQTGNITFTTATPATTAGASTLVVQATGGAGQIILDDGAGTGTALNGNGGTISLNAGTGGIVAASANNTAAEIATTGATVTLNTTGPIGTSSNRIQFADNANTAQQNVVIGQIGSTIEPSSVFLDGLGSLTLGNIQGGTVNTRSTSRPGRTWWWPRAPRSTAARAPSAWRRPEGGRHGRRRRGHALDRRGGHGHLDQCHGQRHHAPRGGHRHRHQRQPGRGRRPAPPEHHAHRHPHRAE